MNYCIAYKKPRTGFIVLDSPLVTFRKAESQLDNNEAISEDMKNLFYSNLSKTTVDRQIIVIENYNPPKNVVEKINYLHFTKDYTNGRYGFIPVSQDTL